MNETREESHDFNRAECQKDRFKHLEKLLERHDKTIKGKV
jgi:hypothetical protein